MGPPGGPSSADFRGLLPVNAHHVNLPKNARTNACSPGNPFIGSLSEAAAPGPSLSLARGPRLAVMEPTSRKACAREAGACYSRRRGLFEVEGEAQGAPASSLGAKERYNNAPRTCLDAGDLSFPYVLERVTSGAPSAFLRGALVRLACSPANPEGLNESVTIATCESGPQQRQSCPRIRVRQARRRRRGDPIRNCDDGTTAQPRMRIGHRVRRRHSGREG
jgi:hypothetical protein